MSILGIPELIKRLKAAFYFVNVMLWDILKLFKIKNLSDLRIEVLDFLGILQIKMN